MSFTPPSKDDLDQWTDHAHTMGQELIGHLKDLKNKYDGLDESHKKAVLAGLAGLTGLLAGSAMARKKNDNSEDTEE